MNSTLFKNNVPENSTRHASATQGEHRSVYKLGIQLGKTKEGLQYKIRKFGELGWVIAVPTVLGAALGLWLDTLWPSDYSWFRILLPTGTLLGCLAAIVWGYQDQNS